MPVSYPQRIATIVASGFLVVIGLAMASAARATPVSYTAGHGDIRLVYDQAAPSFSMVYDFDGSAVPVSLRGTTVAPAEIVTVVPNNQTAPSQNSLLRPAGSQWDFLGVPAGGRIWYLPQASTSGVPFLGVSAEGLGSSTNWQGANPAILFAVAGVTQKPLPTSVVSAWDFGGAGGALRVLWSTATEPWTNAMNTFVGSHAHYNIGFSHQGTYQVQLQATGTRADGTVVTSPPTTYTFQVVPEPAGLALLAAAGLAGLTGLARRRAVR
ncbi:MAG: PEP-CTERM sorting domain-containing protein [Planctomycetes bacterium]|nr:PEP-CTERM sorting domain-containing protein [Planctomycetota bacterium]